MGVVVVVVVGVVVVMVIIVMVGVRLPFVVDDVIDTAL